MRDTVELKKMAVSRLGKDVVDLENVSVVYDDPSLPGGKRPVLKKVTWRIAPRRAHRHPGRERRG